MGLFVRDDVRDWRRIKSQRRISAIHDKLERKQPAKRPRVKHMTRS